MTPEQQACAFMALPFLSLALAWGIGLHFLVPKQQPVKIRRKK